MPRAHDAALEQGECRFDGIGVNVAVGIFLRVVNRLVARAHVFECPRIDSGFVGQNHFHVVANVGVDNLLNRLRLRIFGANQSEIAVPLPDANNNLRFVLRTPAALLASYISLINLDFAAKFFGCHFKHGRAYPVAEVPRRLIADSEGSLDLAGAHALFGLAEQVCCEEPLGQGQVRIVENRSRRCTELVVARITVVLSAIGDCGRWLFAAGAGNAIAPTQGFDVSAAGLIIAKLFD